MKVTDRLNSLRDVDMYLEIYLRAHVQMNTYMRVHMQHSQAMGLSESIVCLTLIGLKPHAVDEGVSFHVILLCMAQSTQHSMCRRGKNRVYVSFSTWALSVLCVTAIGMKPLLPFHVLQSQW